MFLTPGSRARQKRFNSATHLTLNGTNFSYIPPSPNRYRYIPWSLGASIAFNQNNFWQYSTLLGQYCFVAPPWARFVGLDASLWATSGVATTGSMTIKWIKNTLIDASGFQVTGTGIELLAGVGSQSDFGANTATIRAGGYVKVNPGDYFSAFCFLDSTSLGVATVVVDGNNFHTHCSAAAFA